jgi:hypothetical protein
MQKHKFKVKATPVGYGGEGYWLSAPKPGRIVGQLGGSLSWYHNNFSAGVTYDMEKRRNFSSHTGTIKLRYML